MTSKKPININAEMEKANMRMERKALGTSKSEESTREPVGSKSLKRVEGSVDKVELPSTDEMPIIAKCSCEDESFDIDKQIELTHSDLEQIKTALSILINGVLPSLSGVLSQGKEKDAELLKKLEAVE